MVLLKDILNQEKTPNESSADANPTLTDESPLGTSSHMQGHSPGSKRNSQSSCDGCHEMNGHVRREGDLPSPPFSISCSGSCKGNSDNESENESNTSKCENNSPTSHMNTPPSDCVSSNDEEQLVCEWDGCGKTFVQAELLYHHLCSEHVGRKSQKNLQLNCKWKNCNAKTEKRDHITSHLRVHVPLKPFKCSTCNKKFKRPQDLKKHLKIHVESHINVKKKRGPRAGSKRINKNNLNTETTVCYNDTSKKQLLEKDNSSGMPVSATMISNMPHSLPPISVQQLVSHELSSYEPIYTKKLSNRLQTLLPPLSNDDKLTRTSPTATSNAVRFFSNLSHNMNNLLANGQYGYTQQPTLTNTTNEVPINNHTHSPLLNNNAITGGSVSGWSTAYPRSKYPEIHHLPPIESPYAAQEPRLPSLPSVPALTPRYNTFDRIPHFSTHDQYFSSTQRSTGKDDKTAISSEEEAIQKLSGLNLSSDSKVENEDLTEFVDVLQRVNIMKDYFMCLLLEEEYESEDTVNNSLNNLKFDGGRNDRSIRKLPSYPQLIV